MVKTDEEYSLPELPNWKPNEPLELELEEREELGDMEEEAEEEREEEENKKGINKK